jgi:hypothetical protein
MADLKNAWGSGFGQYCLLKLTQMQVTYDETMRNGWR